MLKKLRKKILNCKNIFIKDKLPSSWIVMPLSIIVIVLIFLPILLAKPTNYDIWESIQYYSYWISSLILPLIYLTKFWFNTMFNMIIYDPVKLENTYNFGYNVISFTITLAINFFGNYFALMNISNIVISLLFSGTIITLGFLVNDRLTVCFLSLTDSIR